LTRIINQAVVRRVDVEEVLAMVMMELPLTHKDSSKYARRVPK
jgi:hypothetical protein